MASLFGGSQDLALRWHLLGSPWAEDPARVVRVSRFHPGAGTALLEGPSLAVMYRDLPSDPNRSRQQIDSGVNELFLAIMFLAFPKDLSRHFQRLFLHPTTMSVSFPLPEPFDSAPGPNPHGLPLV